MVDFAQWVIPLITATISKRYIVFFLFVIINYHHGVTDYGLNYFYDTDHKLYI